MDPLVEPIIFLGMIERRTTWRVHVRALAGGTLAQQVPFPPSLAFSKDVRSSPTPRVCEVGAVFMVFKKGVPKADIRVWGVPLPSGMVLRVPSLLMVVSTCVHICHRHGSTLRALNPRSLF